MVAKAGSGHLGTSLSSLDIVTWLHLNDLIDGGEEKTAAVYFSSKGHDAPALYAVLTGLGKLDFELIHRLRRLDGLPGHPDIGTPGVWTNTGSLGMGVSKAKGFAKAVRLRGERREIFVMTGDGELQEGQFWESLGGAAHEHFSEITVIVDHNKLQSDTFVDEILPLGDIAAKFKSFGWEALRCDGHDFAALAEAISEARASKNPVAIIADTIKGRGVSFMEHTKLKPGQLYSYHSGAPSAEEAKMAFEELTQAASSSFRRHGLERPTFVTTKIETRAPQQKYEVENLPVAYGQLLRAQGVSDKRIVVLDADLHVDTGVLGFKRALPERFIECGIAEQDMVSQAGALALEGLLPFVHSFSCFLSTRPNEQIYNNATEATKVVYVGSLAGLLPAGPGHSHQAVRDIASLGAMPGMTMVQPSCSAELERALDWIVGEATGSVYLRLCSGNRHRSFKYDLDEPFMVGRGSVIKEGDEAVLFTYGTTMLEQAYMASCLLEERGRSVKVVNLPWLNRVDDAWFAQIIGDTQTVATVDDHFVEQGQGQMLLSRLATLNIKKAVQMGVDRIPVCGQDDEVLAHHRLDASSIADRLEEAITSN